MNVNHTVCDECQRVKGASNHWYQMGVSTSKAGLVGIELGAFYGPHDWTCAEEDQPHYEIRDLCGEQCFYKHIGKLLKLNPTPTMESSDDD